jgi:pilus assembly protein Flp/PilA
MVVPAGRADTLDHQMLSRLPPLFWRLTRNQRGVTLVEYGLLVALLSVVMVGALNTLGPAIQAVLTTAANAMN